jgi:hypothetical protein
VTASILGLAPSLSLPPKGEAAGLSLPGGLAASSGVTAPLVGEVRRGAAQGAAFTASRTAVPVSVVTHGSLPSTTGAVVVTIESEPGHDHPGGECLVCSTRGNVRVLLFELLEQARIGAVPKFNSVIVDARRAAYPQAVIDALVPGRLPAFGLRDHTVARSFRLA